MNSSKRRFSAMEYVPSYERTIISARVSLETLHMLNSLQTDYPHLFENKSHVIEAAIRRLYYYKRKVLTARKGKT